MSLEKTPVTIITGFLGAGKTTLIRHLLQNPGGRRLAVVVNEFGDVGVDGALIRECADANCPEANILELTNGCICCTVADEFIPAIERLMALEPRDLGILAYSLRNNKEVKDPAEFFDRIPDVKADPKMVAIAEKIIEQLEGDFDPSEFNDRYEDALRKLIADKEAHHGVVSKLEEPKEAEVIDLMEALRRSLGEGSGSRRRSEPRSGAKKASARKTPARKRAS